MSNIPVYDTAQDPAVSDKVKMKSNPVYQEMPSDQGPDPAYQDLSSHLVNQLEMLTIMKTLLVIKILK